MDISSNISSNISGVGSRLILLLSGVGSRLILLLSGDGHIFDISSILLLSGDLAISKQCLDISSNISSNSACIQGVLEYVDTK